VTRRGRPRSARAASAKIIRIKLRLYPGEDDDLIAFFGEIPTGLRARMVKDALRSGIEIPAEATSADSTDDLLEVLDTFVN
jgi:hypothetical protein